ncbi:hypothetical protein HDU79_002188 [Rhizoclosmatium sp. JEL0117]|nr:hypothetical protein HDU79_002188 [Rhizoclosmatium sp. JEL0117]
MEVVSKNKVAGGFLYKVKIGSAPSLGGLSSTANVYVPPAALGGGHKVPAVVFLAGLTCTEDNAAQKGGFFNAAARTGLALIFPDTSPRGAGITGESDAWDFGVGAGFYLNATKEPFAQFYNMENFVTKDLLEAIAATPLFNAIDTSKLSVTGHSMGGHGALTLYLKHPSLFRAASAFAPICNPTQCPWGVKAFSGYLSGGVEEGKAHDATELISKVDRTRRINILVDSGLDDAFHMQKQLLPENFEKASRAAGFGEDQVQVNLREGYDHSYYFVSSFAEAHIDWHAKQLL